MKRRLVLLCLLMTCLASAAPVDMIFWENQSWMPGGGSQRLTLWADGRSEVTVKIYGHGPAPNPGWTREERPPFTLYHHPNALPTPEVHRRFTGALAAGIQLLRSFPPGYSDGSGTLVGFQSDGKLTQTTVPMFLHEGEKDNKGSDNEHRFQAVKTCIGTFDTSAFTR